MYSQNKIQEKLHLAKLHLGWVPEYHTVEECDYMTQRLNEAIENDDSRNVTFIRPLSNAEIRWIRNERALSFCDAMYWKTRYAYLSDETNTLKHYVPRRSQVIFNNIVASLEDKEQSIEIQALKSRQVGLCLTPETRILSADLRWVRLDDIQAGQEIVACDEGDERPAYIRRFNRDKNVKHDRFADRKLRRAIVTAKWEANEPAIRITLEDGRTVTATPSHRFLVRRNDTMWLQSKFIGVGDYLRNVTKPWGEPTFEDGWFSGILDGEGSMRDGHQRSGAEVNVTQALTGVFDRARSYLKSRNYTFAERIDDRPAGPKSKFSQQPIGRLVLSRMDEIFRLIGQTRPIRFIGKNWWEGKGLPGKCSGTSWVKVTSVELLPTQRMIDLQTSTRTFIAEGVVSHNSTEVELDFTHRVMFTPGAQAVAASVDSQKSELMANMFYTAIGKSPWWQIPRILKDRRSGGRGLMQFHTGSIVAIQSGSQDTGIAQGWTPNLVHISECCDYPNPVQTLEEGLMRACHSTRSLYLVFESTGNGNTGWWPDTWRSSKEGYWDGRARLLPVFIPWYAATDLYPEKDWIAKFPIPENWRPSRECQVHANKARAFVRGTSYLRAEFGGDWEMPREQMWFWQFNYDEACKKRVGKSWLRQMPGDDIEALQGKHDSVFDPEVIEIKTENRKRDYKVYAIVGEGIDEKFEPHDSEVDYDGARIEVEWETPRGTVLQWLLVPLKPIDERDEKTAMTKLLVFEDPIAGCDYGMGCDTAEGHGDEGDNTVFNVGRKGFSGEPDVQAAEFCSNVVSTADAAPFIACIAAYYGKNVPGYGMPMIAVEQRRKPGDDAQNQLIKMGFYRHFQFHRLDGKRPEQEERRSNRLGWYTNEWSRPYMHGRFIDAIENGWYEVNSIFLIRECDSLEHSRGGKKSTIDHKDGKHDDRVFASGITIVILHTRDVHIERSQKRYAAPKDRLPELDLGPVTSLQFSVGEMHE